MIIQPQPNKKMHAVKRKAVDLKEADQMNQRRRKESEMKKQKQEAKKEEMRESNDTLVLALEGRHGEGR